MAEQRSAHLQVGGNVPVTGGGKRAPPAASIDTASLYADMLNLEPGESITVSGTLWTTRSTTTTVMGPKSALAAANHGAASDTGATAIVPPGGFPAPATGGDSNAPSAIPPTRLDGGHVAANISMSRNQRYRMRRELGQGGMATVYDAVDLDLRRHVAIKVLRDEHRNDAGTHSDGRSNLQRFIEEAQITGQLEHPNIVPVHEIGRDEAGRFYFTMKRIEGQSLRDILDDLRAGKAEALERWDFYACCEVFLKVCDAIGFAHSRRVIHRDLKPDNIMVGRFGEVQVMDWGLAKLLEEQPVPNAVPKKGASQTTFTGMVSVNAPADAAAAANPASIRSDAGTTTTSQHTIEGTISGTPAYMPPEQARGEISRIDQRSDVFMLGAILYELITLVPPYHAESSISALRRAQACDLSQPKQAVADLERSGRLPDLTPVAAVAIARSKKFPPELAAIAMRALAERPEARYQTPEALAEDINRYIKGETVSVYRDPPVKAAMKWALRNRVVATTAAAVILVVLLAAVGFTWLLKTQAQDDATHERSLADAASSARAQADENARAQKSLAEVEARERQKADEQNKKHVQRAAAQAELNLANDGLLRLSIIQDPELVYKARLKAHEHYDRAIAVDPGYGAPYIGRGSLNVDLGRMDAAVDDFRDGIRLSEAESFKPSPAHCMNAVMAVLMRQQFRALPPDGDIEATMRGLLEKARDAADVGSDYWELADILLMSFAVGEEKSPSDPSVIARREKMSERLGKLARPDQPLWEVYLFSAAVLIRENMVPGEEALTRAVKLIDRALQIRPQLVAAVFLRNMLLETGQHAEGAPPQTEAQLRAQITVYDDYVARFPFDPSGYYARGWFAIKMIGGPDRKGALEKAGLPADHFNPEADYRRAIELDPENDDARWILGQLLEEDGRPGEAAECFAGMLPGWKKSELRITPASKLKNSLASAVQHTLGLLIRRGKLADAATMLNEIQAVCEGHSNSYSSYFAAAMRHARVRVVGTKASDAEAFVKKVYPKNPTAADAFAASSTLRVFSFRSAPSQAYFNEGTRLAQVVPQKDIALAKEQVQAEEGALEALSGFLGGKTVELAGIELMAALRLKAQVAPLTEEEQRRLMIEVFRNPEDATITELRDTVVWLAKQEAAHAPWEGKETREKTIRVLYIELYRADRETAGKAASDCPELKTVVAAIMPKWPQNGRGPRPPGNQPAGPGGSAGGTTGSGRSQPSPVPSGTPAPSASGPSRS